MVIDNEFDEMDLIATEDKFTLCKCLYFDMNKRYLLG